MPIQLGPPPHAEGNHDVSTKRQTFSMDHPIIITFLIFAVIAFMYLAAEVLKPLALAILLSFALAPLVRLLERAGLPRAGAVILTVMLAMGALGLIGYEVGQQFHQLGKNLDTYQKNIITKLKRFKSKEEGAIEKLTKIGANVARSLDNPPTVENVQNVNIVSQPSFGERLKSAVGPYVEYFGIAAFDLILVLFILVHRQDLSDRIVRLFGQGRVSLTTKTMEEAGQRISRYLMMFAAVNSTVGLVVGIGLALIGIPLAALWGVLAALFRFIPYVGPATAFALPLIFSVAVSPEPGWRQPVMVIALFVTIEVLANSFLEPVIYGKTTGVSALGLLVAAMFWTWLWGVLGLLLSTPMTVCLAVLGKYVPRLRVFATLLGEEPPLEPDVRFYQRLLAMDDDGATTIVEEELKKKPRVEVFDQILVPTLSHAERDRARDNIDEREQAFVWRIIGDLLDDLGQTPETNLKSLSPEAQNAPAFPESVRVVGIAANDHADTLALRMLDLLLAPSGCKLEIIESHETPLKLAEKVSELAPKLVVLSHLPPAGYTTARYLVRRLRARFPDLPILVGRWKESGDPAQVSEAMTTVGASHVVFLVGDARDHILEKLLPKSEPDEPTKALVPAPTHPAAATA